MKILIQQQGFHWIWDWEGGMWMAASCDILMFDGTVTPRYPSKTGYQTTFKV